MDGEKENLRAKNIIWTAAGDYTFRPQFLAENGNETLDLYLNMVIGLVHKWYDTDKVAAYFDSLGGTEHQGATSTEPPDAAPNKNRLRIQNT